MALLLTAIFIAYFLLSHLPRARPFCVTYSDWVTAIPTGSFPKILLFQVIYLTIISVRISKLDAAIRSNLVKECVSKKAFFSFIITYTSTNYTKLKEIKIYIKLYTHTKTKPYCSSQQIGYIKH